MSNTGLSKENSELEINSGRLEQLDIGYIDLQIKYNELKTENYKLKQENSILKDVVVDNNKEEFQNSLFEKDLLNPVLEFPKIGKSLYIQIILGISVIVLSLGFHILYLAVTSGLMYNDGDPSSWIVSWLGIDLHASLFLDLMLYSLILLQVILIVLIIRNTLVKNK